MRLAIVYAFLAAISTVTNIATQDVFVRLYQGAYSIGLSILAGTVVGLIVKYILDKRYIFHFKAENAQHDGQVFLLYALMGLVTTAVFWGLELIFHYLYETKHMRYVGGVIGLAIGYWLKYHLDKRFVFKKHE